MDTKNFERGGFSDDVAYCGRDGLHPPHMSYQRKWQNGTGRNGVRYPLACPLKLSTSYYIALPVSIYIRCDLVVLMTSHLHNDGISAHRAQDIREAETYPGSCPIEIGWNLRLILHPVDVRCPLSNAILHGRDSA